MAGMSKQRGWQFACRPPTAGFTLVELMVVLIILGVIIAFGVPSYQTLALRTQLKTLANELVSSAYLARSEAIKRNAPMRLCISADGETCVAGGDWDQGWIVLDPNDLVVKHHQVVPNIKVFELSSVHTLSFQPSGVTTGALTPSGSSPPPLTFTVCKQLPSPGIEEREVTVSPTGQLTVATTTNKSCP